MAVERGDSSLNRASLNLSRYRVASNEVVLSDAAHEIDPSLGTSCAESTVAEEKVLICRRSFVKSGVTINTTQAFILRSRFMFVINLFSVDDEPEIFMSILENIKINDPRK